jgi:hypothetical protein
MFEIISVEEYGELAAELDAQETIMLAGRWPVSVGRHPDLGHIALAHIGDMAMVGTAPGADAIRAKFASLDGA